jgi:hypothetical protein
MTLLVRERRKNAILFAMLPHDATEPFFCELGEANRAVAVKSKRPTRIGLTFPCGGNGSRTRDLLTASQAL